MRVQHNIILDIRDLSVMIKNALPDLPPKVKVVMTRSTEDSTPQLEVRWEDDCQEPTTTEPTSGESWTPPAA